WDFNDGAGVSGAGTVQFPSNSWPARFDAGSTYDVTGTTNVQADVTFFPGSSVPSAGALVVPGGRVNFSTGAAVSAASLALSAGTVTGPDTLTVSGATTWTGGAMSGPGVTVAQGGLSIGATDNTDQAKTLTVRTLVNAGAGTMTGTHPLDEDNSGTFRNAAGATLDLPGDAVSWDGND